MKTTWLRPGEPARDSAHDGEKVIVRKIRLHGVTRATTGQTVFDDVALRAVTAINAVVGEASVVPCPCPNLRRGNSAVMAVRGCQAQELITREIEDDSRLSGPLPIDADHFSSGGISSRPRAGEVPFPAPCVTTAGSEDTAPKMVFPLNDDRSASSAGAFPLCSCSASTGSFSEDSEDPKLSAREVFQSVEHGKVYHLATGAFKESGTMVNAAICVITG